MGAVSNRYFFEGSVAVAAVAVDASLWTEEKDDRAVDTGEVAAEADFLLWRELELGDLTGLTDVTETALSL